MTERQVKINLFIKSIFLYMSFEITYFEKKKRTFIEFGIYYKRRFRKRDFIIVFYLFFMRIAFRKTHDVAGAIPDVDQFCRHVHPRAYS